MKTRWITGIELLVIIVCSAILVWFASRPVHLLRVPTSPDIRPAYAQSLTGVKGQTMSVPKGGLSRIDLEVRPVLVRGERIQMIFEIFDYPRSDTLISSGSIFINDSSDNLPIALILDDPILHEGDPIYLRMAIVTTDPADRFYYRYSRTDTYAKGEFLDLDAIEVKGQDLYFRLYSPPNNPAPIVWVEALLDKVVAYPVANPISINESSGLLLLCIVSIVVIGGAILMTICYQYGTGRQSWTSRIAASLVSATMFVATIATNEIFIPGVAVNLV